MIGKLMKDWAGNLKRGEVCACFVFAVLFAWAVLLPELGKFGLKQVALFSIGLSIVSASVLVAICDQIKQINRKERVAARRSSKQVRIAFLLCFAALEFRFLRCCCLIGLAFALRTQTTSSTRSWAFPSGARGIVTTGWRTTILFSTPSLFGWSFRLRRSLAASICR